MRCCLKSIVLSLALLLVTSTLDAQTTTAPVVAAPVATPAAGGFWSSVCASCAAKKAALSNSPLCKLLKNALGPLSALTGGLVPGAVGPSTQDLAAPGTVGAAAKIKQDQAQAAKRRDAVRFLGTIDCHWFPEAEAGLVAALRIDRSECVRFEAARSLARGCCCTKTTVEALSICVAGDDRDGNPAENSLRVQLMALEALQRCMSSYQGGGSEEALPRPEHPASKEVASQQADADTELPEVRFTAYYEKVRVASREEVYANAGRTLAKASTRQVALPQQSKRYNSVYEIWQQAEK